MATANYIIGRRKYARPQAMLWSENPGTLQIINPGTQDAETYYVPAGFEIGTNPTDVNDQALADQFLILSDDNRGPIDFRVERIEKRERMINGRMRSHHIADKLTINVSWDMLPSRSYADLASFNSLTGISPDKGSTLEYTTDGGAGGVDMLKWYEDHTESFWVFLAYDKYSNFGAGVNQYIQLNKYNQVLEMYIADFSYSVVKRGGSNFDFWNIQVTLEEV